MAVRERSRVRDLSGNNRLPRVLEERDDLCWRMADDKERFAEIREEIMDALGDADTGHLPGWLIAREVRFYKAHWVDDKEVTYIFVKRVDKLCPAAPSAKPAAKAEAEAEAQSIKRTAEAGARIILRRPTS
jgi:hypothetical protein